MEKRRLRLFLAKSHHIFYDYYFKGKQGSVKKHLESNINELDLIYNKIIEEKEEIARNVNWKLKSFEFDNLTIKQIR